METWRYKARSITKYNPKNYDSAGAYLIDEWTSYSDIGKGIDPVANALLSKEGYLEVEGNYISAVKMFMTEVNAKKIKVIELYKISDADDFDKYDDKVLFDFYTELKEKEYSISSLHIIMQLILREYMQASIQLVTPKMDSTVYFGYDYYMYFVSDTFDFNNLQKELIKYRIFVG